MDRTYASGLAWTALSKWAVQVVSWTITIWVARLLSPTDYGIMGMARVYIAFALMLSEAGLGAAVLRYQNLGSSELRQLNTVALSLGLVMASVSIAVSGAVAAFFSSPNLSAVLTVMSLTFLAAGFKVVPYALLRRDLKYRFLAFADGSSAMLGGIVTLVLAFRGGTYWALVIGALTESVALAVLPLLKRPVGIRVPKLRAIAEPLSYGYQMISQRFTGYIYLSADRVIIGRILGEAPLGAYSFATTLANAPVEKISDTAGRVTSTVLAAVQDAPREMARYFLRTTEALALITMPACVGLGLVAPDLVLGLLGEKWTAMILPLQILSVVAVTKALQPLGAMVGNLRGQERLLSRLNLGIAIVFPPIMWLTARWGIVGVSASWLVVFPLFAAARISIGCRSVGVSFQDYSRVLMPAATSTAIMTGFVLGAQMISGSGGHITRMAIAIVTGAVSYALSLFLMHRERVMSIVGFVRRMRGPDPAARHAD